MRQERWSTHIEKAIRVPDSLRNNAADSGEGGLSKLRADFLDECGFERKLRGECLDSFQRRRADVVLHSFDIVARVGLGATAQVDLGVREHRNRPLEDLGPQATAILATALGRAGLTHHDSPMLRRFTQHNEYEAVNVEVRERLPMADVAAYCEKFGLDLRATG